MQLLLFIAIALLICQGWAFHGPELKTRDPGFHRRRAARVSSTDGYKLPGNARPLSYDVTLTLTPYNYLVYGDVTIILDVDPSGTINQTNTLQLNADINWDHEIPGTFVWNDAMNCSIKSFGSAYVEIECPESIEGDSQTLRITYTTNYASIDEYGMYTVNYRESDVDKSIIATQLEQDYARRLFPCFDEPEYKAPITLTLKTDTTEYNWSHWIANTKVASESTDGAIVTTTFEATPNMSAYLLAFVATPDFKNYSNPDLEADYEFQIFAKPTAENFLSIALENGPKLIDLMGDYIGIKYTDLGNDRMVFAAIPEFTAGAMENWGLITFREQIIIDEGTETTARDKQTIVKVIAHELAHQWFGDYVTLDWWSETWLNEGFATYFEYYLSGQIFSDFNMDKQLIIIEKQQALKTDSYPDAAPLSDNASEITTDLWSEFGDISYSKGASIIAVLYQALGDFPFKTGLETYLHLNNYSNPSAKTLLDSLQSAIPDGIDLDLNKLFKEWIYESGYPLLDVSLSDENEVTITAVKFSASLDKSKENNTAIWWIPLTYTTSEKPDFDTISFDWTYSSDLSNFTVTLPNKDNAWIIFNLQSSGYYRVNYDQNLWNRIINVLNNSETYATIDALNRAQLIDDIFNVAKSYKSEEENGTLYYLTAFKLAEYLQYETEYYPWYTFLTEMQYLIELIQDELTLSTLKDKILSLISPQLVIPNDTDEPSHTEILKRNLLLTWACNLGHENCTRWAQEKFEIFKSTFSVDSNYRDVILCTGMALTNTSRTDYKYILGYLEASLLPYKQIDLLKALTCTSKGELAVELLTNTIDYIPSEQPISRMYNDKILSTLLTEGFDKIQSALKFALTYDNGIEQYWQQIEDAETVVKKIAAKIYNQYHIDTINAYITKYQNMSEYDSRIVAAKEAIEIANENIQYLNEYSTILTSVIVYNGGPLTTEPPTTTTSPATESPTPTPTTQSPPTTPGNANKLTYNILLATISALVLKYILC